MKPKKYEPLIPGYTGHLPLDYFDKKPPSTEALQGGHIPGYSGYVNKIKPENYFGQSFGKITSEINGRQPPLNEEFVTTAQATFVDQTKLRCKKASEIVGVQWAPKQYIRPSDDDISRLGQTVRRVEGWAGTESQHVPPEATQALFIDTEFIQQALPGYTGHNQKVYASNVFGLSFKRAQERARQNLIEDRQTTAEKVRSQCQEVPPLFVSQRNECQNR